MPRSKRSSALCPLNHSSALAYYVGAELYARSGDPATATAYARRALRLSPFDPGAQFDGP